MGGHDAGDVASAVAVEELAQVRHPGSTLDVDSILAALDDANRVIVAQGGVNGMGTTITGLAGVETAGGTHVLVFNVGDSRVYQLAGDRLDQVSVDHSEVQELVLAGTLTPRAGAHPPTTQRRHPGPGQRHHRPARPLAAAGYRGGSVPAVL